jgi:uncharacterized protein (TIGR02453 family)
VERFRGFGRETRLFLAGIDANNRRDWFDAHRDDYERHYIEPALAFIREVAPRLRMVAPRVTAEAKINGSLLRINHDMRFSKDKRPYKERLDFWFWEGFRRGWDRPGLFMRITSTSVILGSGMRRFVGPQLEAYRDAVVGAAGEELEIMLRRLRAAGYEVPDATRKRVPAGFDPDHQRGHLLRHDGISALLAESNMKVCESRGFVDYAARHFAALAPLNDWVRTALAATQ